MTSAITHRIPRPLSVLTALAALVLSAPLALIGAPAHAADDDSAIFTLSMDIVVKSDDTYSAKFVMSENGEYPVLKESTCTKDSFMAGSSTSNLDNVKATFKEDGDTRTCTMEGTGGSISTSSKNIKHEGDEYIVQTLNFDSISDEDVTEISQSVTFPGKVTEADGGTVEGTKVSFKDNDKHEVKGKDEPAKSAAAGSSQGAAAEEDSGSIPVWVWILIGSLAVAIVGGVVGVLVMNQRKKKQSQLVAYAAAAQVYDPNQAPFGQPMQQPFQPGYAEPAAQPYQPGQPTPQPYQPGQPGQQLYQPGYTEPYQPGQPTPQPYQPSYAEPYQPSQPTPQPYQLGQPGQQPYQPGYTDPATQPYQPPYGNQPGQPGQRF